MDDLQTPPRGASLIRRMIRTPLVTLPIAAGFMVGASYVGTQLARLAGAEQSGIGAVVGGAIVALVFIIAYAAFTRLVEQRKVAEFALPGWYAELGAGLAIGALLMAVVVGVMALAGAYTIIGAQPLAAIYPAIGIAIVSGVTEEIMLRALFFRIIEGWLGSWIALALSAALFGALHLGNPNATLLAGAAITIEAGVMLAALFMVTRRLWAVMGLHAAWNFVQGGIFGISVSGFEMDGLLRPSITGPEWLTGGEFGAEASLPAVLICTGFGMAMLVVARRRNRFIAPFWARAVQGAAEQA